MPTVIAWIAVVVLAVVLLTAAKVDALRGTPRSRWLSFAGGVAITYVFLKLLRELTHAQEQIEARHPSAGWLREHLLFLLALGGAAVLFAVERAAKRTKQARKQRGEEERSAAWVFWLHAVIMSAYAAFIGYLLFHQPHGARAVAVLGVVMALHFAGIAVALTDDYKSLYLTRGRWLLAAAVVIGGAVGPGMRLPDAVFHPVLGAMAGAVVFSVIKEEIPPEQQSRFWPLAVGIAVTAALLRVAG